MKRVDNAVYGAIQRAVEGTFTGGTQMFNASNDGIGLAPFHDAAAASSTRGAGQTAGGCCGLQSGAIMVKTEAR